MSSASSTWKPAGTIAASLAASSAAKPSTSTSTSTIVPQGTSLGPSPPRQLCRPAGLIQQPAECRSRQLACPYRDLGGRTATRRPRPRPDDRADGRTAGWRTTRTCAPWRWRCRTWRRSTATALISGWAAGASSGLIPSTGREAPAHQERHRRALRGRRSREAGPTARRAGPLLHRRGVRRLAARTGQAGASQPRQAGRTGDRRVADAGTRRARRAVRRAVSRECPRRAGWRSWPGPCAAGGRRPRSR